MTAWQFVAVLGVILAGLALIAWVLGQVTSRVARAVGDVGAALVNPVPHPQPERQTLPPGAETTSLTDDDRQQPPWERWPEPYSRPLNGAPAATHPSQEEEVATGGDS